MPLLPWFQLPTTAAAVGFNFCFAEKKLIVTTGKSVLIHPLVAVGVVAVVDPNIVAAAAASCF